MAVAVGKGTGVSEGMAVASGCEMGSPQAVMSMERIKTKDSNFTNLLDRFMGTSFFGKALTNYTSKPPYGRLVCIKLIFI
jgi:hypothetical protein